MLSRYRFIGSILSRLPGPGVRPVDGDDHTGRRDLRVDELQGGARTSFREQPAPGPQHERVDQHRILVDQVVAYQGLDEVAASEHHKVLLRTLPQLGHGLARVALEERGVLPGERLAQGPRRDVLLRSVEHVGERVRLWLVGPEVVEVLVRAPAEQERASGGDPPSRDVRHDLVAVADLPPAEAELAARVLVGPARRLHDAVERDVREGDDLAHGVVLGRAWSSHPGPDAARCTFGALTLYTNANRPNRREGARFPRTRCLPVRDAPRRRSRRRTPR